MSVMNDYKQSVNSYNSFETCAFFALHGDPLWAVVKVCTRVVDVLMYHIFWLIFLHLDFRVRRLRFADFQ